MKRITLLLILAYLSPYGVAQEVPLYETITDNVPKIGVTTEVYLGDRMTIQRTGIYKECIIPKNNYEKRYIGLMFNIRPNQLICKKDAASETYTPNYKIVSDRYRKAPTEANPYSIKLVKEKGKYTISVCEPGMFTNKLACYSGLTFKDISENEVEVLDRQFMYKENTFQQSIEYAGRDEDNLKFTYSEFTDGFAKQAFSREFQIDYARGDVAAYKGAIIKIHEATNVNIIYEVIRNFQ